jgi:hypothetical protein
MRKRMRRGGRSDWWSVVPIVALAMNAGRANAQSGSAIEATATIIDMTESGGVGIRVRTLAEQALDRIGLRPASAPAWPADTTVWIRRARVRVERLPATEASIPPHLRITVMHLD